MIFYFGSVKICEMKYMWVVALTILVSTAFADSAAAPKTAACVDGAPVTSIKLDGLKNTRPHVVTRELLHREGGTFSLAAFRQEKSKLQDLDLFTDVNVTCDGGELTYHLKEIFRWIPAPAGKKTDRDGLMIGAALANLNVAGEDIRAEVQYRTSVSPFFENHEYAFYASSPYLLGLPLGWNFEFLRTSSYDDIRDFDERSWLADLDLDLALSSHFSLLISGAYRYLEKVGHLPEIGGGFAMDYRDAAIDTRSGFYLEYMASHIGYEGSTRSGMGGNYAEILVDSRLFVNTWKFVSNGNVLFRYRPGQVGEYDYFYHGGANTFRGHEADNTHLGAHEALLNFEERFILLERRPASILGINFFYGLQLVAGLDGSLLWDKGSPAWKNFEGAVYGGIHLIIPALDRIRVEVGYSPDTGEPKLFIGLFEHGVSARWRSR